MVNNAELLYKISAIIEYPKNNNGYEYKVYNHLYAGEEEPDSNIVEYAEDVEEMILELIDCQKEK